MKRTLLSTALVLLPFASYAQDLVVKKDGSIIQAKVLEIGPLEVKYKKWSNQEGPTYTILITDILAINYPNGEKEQFSNVNTTTAQPQEQGYIEKKAAENNASLISKYNKTYYTTDNVKISSKKAIDRYYIMGVTTNSILSNEDLEITIERRIYESPVWEIKKFAYYIKLLNKTNKILYIDKGNCFRNVNNGEAYCYFDGSTQISIGDGSTRGVGVNLGAVASTLGVGGPLGTLASGISVGNSSSSSVNTTYTDTRFIAIPPNSYKYLSEDKEIVTKWGVWKAKDSQVIEYSERFSMLDKSHAAVNKGEIIRYKESNTPYKWKYLITYSNTADFNIYSTLNFEVFLKEIIGLQDFYDNDKKIKIEKYIQDIDEYTIISL